jgi:colanic acid biosynthesis glycosyl transferase WcaI
VRIAVHDFVGHPFQFELSQALARRGHTVRHFFFAEDIGPKGPRTVGPDDPPTLSIEPISLRVSYSKTNFARRRAGDILYGRQAAGSIAAFAPDVVISGNTPLDAQKLILERTRAEGAAFVFWMRDFYSLAVERRLGAGRLVAQHYHRVERRLLQLSDGVVLISEDFTSQLGQFQIPPEKVSVIPNWGALDSIPLRPKANAWAKRHELDDKFVFLYSGTLALKHNPERLWALARAFRDDPEVMVVLAASGVSLDGLKKRDAADPQPNLKFLPLQPIAEFADLLGAADVVVALLESDAGEFSVPSKVLSYMCAGRPILLSAPTGNLAARVVRRSASGLVVPADSETEFVEAARRLRADASAREDCGQAARRYAEESFEIGGVTDRFEAAFDRARTARAKSTTGRVS